MAAGTARCSSCWQETSGAAARSAPATYEEKLNAARRWASEEKFQIAAQLVSGRLSSEASGADIFTSIADAVIAAMLRR